MSRRHLMRKVIAIAVLYCLLSVVCIKVFRGTHTVAPAAAGAPRTDLVIYGSTKSRDLNAAIYIAFWPLIFPLEWFGVVSYYHDIGVSSVPDDTVAERLLGL